MRIKNLVLRNGTPGEIRTPDQLVRSQLLYPAELRARNRGESIQVSENRVTCEVTLSIKLGLGTR